MDGLYLMHHGIKGQKWGVRRYQNPDGTLTDKGKKRYSDKADKIEKKLARADKITKSTANMFEKYVNNAVLLSNSDLTALLMAIRNGARKSQNIKLNNATKYFENTLKQMSKYDIDDPSISHFIEVGARVLESKKMVEQMSRLNASMQSMYNLYNLK